MAPSPARVRPAFLPDADFLRLKAMLIGRTGHFYYEDKDDLLWDRVRQRLHALNLMGIAPYLERLEDPALGEAEWAALEAEITIGETFFFRYAEQFAALRDIILPDILARNAESRRLRIWSAGCANGSEPYSLAILLRQMLGEAIGEWRITLLGTDLNEAALETARGAVFSPWALRSVSAEDRARDFTPDLAGRGWQLRPQHRSMVRFQRHNLLDLLTPGGSLQMTEFDLVLCRNVLIYFHPDTVLSLVHSLAERLVPGGWLLLGHAEPSPAYERFLHPVPLPGTAAWRRGAEGLPPLPKPPPAPPPAPEALPPPAPAPVAWAPLVPPPQPPGRAAMPAAPMAAPMAALPPAANSADDALVRARARADLGDLEGAGLACRQGLEAEPGNAALHFYDALVAWAAGRTAEAERAFRRAIALRDDFAMAHYQLGLLLLAEGRGVPGRKSIAAAARIAQGQPEDAPLQEADGMTAGMLRAAARLHLHGSGTA
ncbi:CheR family methyltransferase [Roseomonas marmotae]|uniref:protein-glutamate O-methyltransferase n=1 Tax=Roseomonas marmotae TaxID=2768161 RepID=A0ABS3KC23_9PROT|nr:protein-glutamate O-methyltransferase CheR [Roseomonas marmotae]MBO1074193.1 protein-glutamate methyltransferase [Roseomonas marmotae]QTI78966.1 protein-glutamate methyltransferase [Roseomonas marmotae]